VMDSNSSSPAARRPGRTSSNKNPGHRCRRRAQFSVSHFAN